MESFSLKKILAEKLWNKERHEIFMFKKSDEIESGSQETRNSE
jgi:hypothetical protein